MTETRDILASRSIDAALRDMIYEAGGLAQDFQERGFETWQKKHGEPVCEADIAVDQLIHARLASITPGIPVISEETENGKNRDIPPAAVFWLVDPIDGTRAFIKGRDDYCISIAMIESGRPVWGRLYAPARDHFYAASSGNGASLNGIALKAKASPRLEQAVMAGSRDFFQSTKVWSEPWPMAGYIRPNSFALRLAIIARGDADMVLTVRQKKGWDMAAAHLILVESGGLVLGEGFSEPTYKTGEERFAWIMAANGARLIDEMSARLRPALKRWSAEGKTF